MRTVLWLAFNKIYEREPPVSTGPQWKTLLWTKIPKGDHHSRTNIVYCSFFSIAEPASLKPPKILPQSFPQKTVKPVWKQGSVLITPCEHMAVFKDPRAGAESDSSVWNPMETKPVSRCMYAYTGSVCASVMPSTMTWMTEIFAVTLHCINCNKCV